MSRFSVSFAGESGHGINLSGEFLLKAIKNYGVRGIGYREYPSLIKGGIALAKVDFHSSNRNLRSITPTTNILVCTSRKALKYYLPRIKKNGIFIHSQQYLNYSSDEVALIKRKRLYEVYFDLEKLLEELNAPKIEGNMIYLGMVARLIALPVKYLEDLVKEQFITKDVIVSSNIKSLNAGYNHTLVKELNEVDILSRIKEDHSVKDAKIITGNDVIALGAIACGVRVYAGYPMTPSTTIMKYLADTYKLTGIIVKQAEDEITAAQIVLGASYMGTRALTATSGGGFDLMTETVSLAGITEVPFVCVIAQRPGPATGLPTWTSDSDLNLAIYSAHGEFTRCVLSVSDLDSCYTQIQRAFNIAEKFQIPVLLLTDKYIAETNFLMNSLPKAEPIERGLVEEEEELNKLTPKDRFRITKDGLSKRWLPTKAHAFYVTNSDEHLEDGTLTEDGPSSEAMYAKRMRKTQLILDELNEPIVYGDTDADISFVGWGSAKGAVLDLIDDRKFLKRKNIKINYLHYDDIYPLRTKRLIDFYEKARKVIFIENNYMGQFRNLIRLETGLGFSEDKDYLLPKYDGRPFYIDDIKRFLKKEFKI